MKKYLLYCLIGLLNPLISHAVPTYEYDGMGPKIVAKGDVFICCLGALDDKLEWFFDFSYLQMTGGSRSGEFIELKAIQEGNTQISVKQYLPNAFGGWSHYMTSYMNLTIQDGCVLVDYSNASQLGSIIGNYDFRISSCKLNFASGLNGVLKGIIQGKESIVLKPKAHIKNGSNLKLTIGNSSLRSSDAGNILLESSDDESNFSENDIAATNVDEIKLASQILTINIYSITGLSVYSSTTNFDVKSVNLSQGIYIVETINDNGEIKREKILINK